MNKTTRKYGKPLYTLHLGCVWGENPPDSVLRNWARLDKYAKQDHNKPYDALTDAQKVQIHFNINSGIYKAQEKEQREKERQNHKSVQTPTNPA